MGEYISWVKRRFIKALPCVVLLVFSAAGWAAWREYTDVITIPIKVEPDGQLVVDALLNGKQGKFTLNLLNSINVHGHSRKPAHLETTPLDQLELGRFTSSSIFIPHARGETAKPNGVVGSIGAPPFGAHVDAGPVEGCRVELDFIHQKMTIDQRPHRPRYIAASNAVVIRDEVARPNSVECIEYIPVDLPTGQRMSISVLGSSGPESVIILPPVIYRSLAKQLHRSPNSSEFEMDAKLSDRTIHFKCIKDSNSEEPWIVLSFTALKCSKIVLDWRDKEVWLEP